MPLRHLLLLAVLMACTVAQAPAQAWCAKPRTPEILLADGRKLAISTEQFWGGQRKALQREGKLGSVTADSVRIVTDETICHRAATTYWAEMRRENPDVFGKRPDSPVLVVAVGSVYLVDDMRERTGSSAYWEVVIYDHSWQRFIGYGGGA